MYTVYLHFSKENQNRIAFIFLLWVFFFFVGWLVGCFFSPLIDLSIPFNEWQYDKSFQFILFKVQTCLYLTQMDFSHNWLEVLKKHFSIEYLKDKIPSSLTVIIFNTNHKQEARAIQYFFYEQKWKPKMAVFGNI